MMGETGKANIFINGNSCDLDITFKSIYLLSKFKQIFQQSCSEEQSDRIYLSHKVVEVSFCIYFLLLYITLPVGNKNRSK
jgi:hypothetical protein